jgi:hypothetical protein
MKPAVLFRIGGLTVVTTAFYTMVGQMVPQKEVHPPAEVAMKKDMSPDEMVKVGRQIMEGKGLCFTCHTVGKSGALRFPDLDGIGAKAATRVPGQDDVQYLAHSIYDPGGYIVPGFNPGMPVINKPPIGLTDQEILAVIATLQSMGGKVSVTMDSKVWGGAAAEAAPAPAPSGAPPSGDPTAPAALAAPVKPQGVSR